jgi:hypothetical protein
MEESEVDETWKTQKTRAKIVFWKLLGDLRLYSSQVFKQS